MGGLVAEREDLDEEGRGEVAVGINPEEGVGDAGPAVAPLGAETRLRGSGEEESESELLGAVKGKPSRRH